MLLKVDCLHNGVEWQEEVDAPDGDRNWGRGDEEMTGGGGIMGAGDGDGIGGG